MKTVVSLAVLFIILAVSPILADTVTLKDGGKVEGLVDEVVLLTGGVEKKFLQGTFIGVTLNAEGEDSVQIDAKTAEKGEVVSLAVKSVGGILTYKRSEISAVTVINASVEELRKQYLAKKAAIKPGDGEAMYQLAVWCSDRGLKAESLEMAQACLKTTVTEETATLAHQMLGHILKDGQWVEPEPFDEKGEEKAKPAPEPGLVKLDPAVGELVRKLVSEYTQKADDLKSKEREELKKKYGADWEKAQAKVKKLDADADANAKRKTDLEQQIANERSYIQAGTTYDETIRRQRVDELGRQYEAARTKVDAIQKSLDAAQREKAALAQKIRAAVAAVSARRSDRTEGLTLAKSKTERLLLEGKTLAEADMRAMFDAALKQ